MKRIAFLLFTVVAVAGVVASSAPASGHAEQEAAPIFGITIPPGYRDWRLVSVAHEKGDLKDIRAILGNDTAIKAYREGKLPFPDGTIIARIAWSYVPSEENNKVFGRAQSFVPGPAVIFQHVVPLSRPYERRRRRSGAKVQIGCNDLQGADLIAPPFARLGAKTKPGRSAFDGYNVLIIYSQPQIGTFSSWSRTQESTPRRADGGSLNSTRKANPALTCEAKNLLSLPRACQKSRLCLHPVRALMRMPIPSSNCLSFTFLM
jgi:hypothetical protein